MTDSKAGSHGSTIAPHAMGMDVVAMGMDVVAIVLVQYRFEIRTLTGTMCCVYEQLVHGVSTHEYYFGRVYEAETFSALAILFFHPYS